MAFVTYASSPARGAVARGAPAEPEIATMSVRNITDEHLIDNYGTGAGHATCKGTLARGQRPADLRVAPEGGSAPAFPFHIGCSTTRLELAFVTMHRLRRVVTVVSSLALLQLTLLGSAAPCIAQASIATGASAHDGHASAMAGSAHEAAHRVTDSPAPHGSRPDSDCAFQACAVPPVLVASAGTEGSPRPETLVFGPVVPDAPISPFYSLDPPPPRA